MWLWEWVRLIYIFSTVTCTFIVKIQCLDSFWDVKMKLEETSLSKKTSKTNFIKLTRDFICRCNVPCVPPGGVMWWRSVGSWRGRWEVSLRLLAVWTLDSNWRLWLPAPLHSPPWQIWHVVWSTWGTPALWPSPAPGVFLLNLLPYLFTVDFVFFNCNMLILQLYENSTLMVRGRERARRCRPKRHKS